MYFKGIIFKRVTYAKQGRFGHMCEWMNEC